METLQAMFPITNFTLLVIIIGLPLLGAAVNGLFGKRLGDQAVSLMALSTVGGAFVLSVMAFVMLLDVQSKEQVARFYWHGWQWMTLSGAMDSGPVPIEVAFSIDALSGTMALIVTGVGFLIHLYSTGYMAGDPGYARFFCYLNLFIFSMLVLILGDNLPVLFVGWEGVGLCSYLLIGFWYTEEKNATAGKKAFITNRIGDFGLLVAMGLLVHYAGALDWTSLSDAADRLLRPVPILPDVPIAHYLPDSWLHVNCATLVGLALFLGCAGKSAQIPLYVWLPDAMAGPTPVSALIHAATMVTAGVYLVCRMSGVFALSAAAMFTVAFVGAVTAVFAATIALVQNDIKKVLAYSTVSQLGYMFLGVGVGAFSAGFFHVMTHAFFKACLFLGAGSVIHAMHARIHDTDKSQDMRSMGGLRKYMPVTFVTFAASWAAIVGLPGTSGFFSKDEILLKALTSSIVTTVEGGKIGYGPKEIELFTWPEWGPVVLCGLGVAGAVMTAFYMSRLVVGIFFGSFRGWTIAPGAASGHVAHDHAHDGEHAGPMEGPAPHESPWSMTLPLVILGGLALVAGALNAHAFFKFAPLDGFLDPIFHHANRFVASSPEAEELEHVALAAGLTAFALGVSLAFWAYIARGGRPMEALARRFPGLHKLMVDKWRIDELYEETLLGAVDLIGDVVTWFDKHVVDFIVARFTSGLVAFTGTVLRYFQTGRVQAYATVTVFGLAAAGWFFLSPHAELSVDGDAGTGTYKLSAARGLGYGYRWDLDGDGTFDSPDPTQQLKAELNLERGQTKLVALEVTNVLGLLAVERRVVERPREDQSGFKDQSTVIDLKRLLNGQVEGQLRNPPAGAHQDGEPGRKPNSDDRAQRWNVRPVPMDLRGGEPPSGLPVAPPGAGAEQPENVGGPQ